MRGWLRRWLVAAALAHCLSLALACPSTCECKWKNGKQTALCSNKELRDIPAGLDPGTQVLDFTGNSVRVVTKERFQILELVNLQRIYLSRNGIAEIADRAFHGLTNLVELDLAHNNLTVVPANVFKDFPLLMRLTLSGNPIRVVGARAFQPLSYLINLELSNCAIETVMDDAFSGLEGLEWLKLDGNRLRGMQGNNVLPKTLHGVDIHNNPWECDCGMIDLRKWISNYRNPLAMEPTCRGPARLRGRTVRELKEEDLACMPEVFPTTLYLEIAEGKNVSLQCKVNATPEAKVSWYFQGNVLQNDTLVAPGVRLLYFVEDGTVEKKSELFIYNTNTEDNGTFVCQAENQAGKMHANYTIRVIVREEPEAEMSGFPMEYVMALAGGLVVVAVVVCVSITVCIISCRNRRRRRRKAESGKAVALQSQSKDGERMGASSGSKINGTVFISDRSQHDLAAFSHQGQDAAAGQAADYYAKNYSLEQNPDLINDAESVGKERRLKEDAGSYQEGSTIDDVPQAQPVWQDVRYAGGPPVGPPMGPPVPMDMYHQPLSADVHLSAGRFLDSEGYPLDYGLPKMSLPHPGISVQPLAQHGGPTLGGPLGPHSMANMYRTLPHKPRLHASVGVRRYSREAEFLSRPSPAAYDPFLPPDVRYTVDGYPTTAAPMPVSPGASLFPPTSQSGGSAATVPPIAEETLPSPPLAYKTDAPLPSPSPFPSGHPPAPCCASQHCQPPSRCSVAAQTGEELKGGAQSTLTESPDEGYEGEGADAEM